MPKIIEITDIDDIPEQLFIFIGGLEYVILMYAKAENEEIVVIQLDSWHLLYGESRSHLVATDKYKFQIEQKQSRI